MKKVIIAACCLFGFAQSNAQVSIKPGVKAGLNLATLSNMNADTRADFFVGGFLDIKLAKFYTLSPELLYSRQGAQVKFANYDDVYSPNDMDIELQYISLGVMNKFRIVEGFHALVGPSLDFKVGDNLDYNDDLIGFDLSILAGVGYTFPNGIGVEARYKQGLLDIFGDDYYDDDYDYYDDDYNNFNDVKLNQVIQIGVTYTF